MRYFSRLGRRLTIAALGPAKQAVGVYQTPATDQYEQFSVHREMHCYDRQWIADSAFRDVRNTAHIDPSQVSGTRRPPTWPVRELRNTSPSGATPSPGKTRSAS